MVCPRKRACSYKDVNLNPMYFLKSYSYNRFLATVGGRVDIDAESGLAVYKRPAGAVGWTKLTPGGTLKHNLFHTGVTGSPQVRKGGKLMMITSISYLIIQVGFGACFTRYSHYKHFSNFYEYCITR